MESETLTNSSQIKQPEPVASTGIKQPEPAATTGARVISVQANLVTIEVAEAAHRPLTKNEVVCIVPQRETVQYQERLKAEVLRVRGREATSQLFERTPAVVLGVLPDQPREFLP